MSVKAKGINADKLLTQIKKADIDEQIQFYYDLRNYLDQELTSRAKEFEEKKEQILKTRSRIIKDEIAGGRE